MTRCWSRTPGAPFLTRVVDNELLHLVLPPAARLAPAVHSLLAGSMPILPARSAPHEGVRRARRLELRKNSWFSANRAGVSRDRRARSPRGVRGQGRPDRMDRAEHLCRPHVSAACGAVPYRRKRRRGMLIELLASQRSAGPTRFDRTGIMARGRLLFGPRQRRLGCRRWRSWPSSRASRASDR